MRLKVILADYVYPGQAITCQLYGREGIIPSVSFGSSMSRTIGEMLTRQEIFYLATTRGVRTLRR